MSGGAGWLTLVKKNHKAIVVLAGFFLTFLISSLLIMYWAVVKVTQDLISQESALAVGDITHTKGAWDTSKYDADPEIPGPYRIYLIAKDGFVIDRWRPIRGYLDTSDFKQLKGYAQPTSVNTVTGQTWRLMSVPITSKSGGIVGLVAVGRYGIAANQLPAIDQELRATASQIINKVSVRGADIDTDNVNVHDIPFQISFQIVDQFNKIKSKSDNSSTLDRLPNYIDPSYISPSLTRQSVKIIKDTGTGEPFLVKTVPIRGNDNQPVGTLIVGRTIAPYIQMLRLYAVARLIAAAILAVVAARLYFFWRGRDPATETTPQNQKLAIDDIWLIHFNKQGHTLHINSHIIPITYASNQYYMCIALFGAPNKRWETDELTDKFGAVHDSGRWRKIYDAMTSVNKKAGDYIDAKLIVTNNKTFRLNPKLINKIKKQI